MKVLELRDVYYTYPDGVEALKGVSLTLGEGETGVLLGLNGSGKTTLLLVAAGLLEPRRGLVSVMGHRLPGRAREARRHIGLLFQNPDDQLFNITVYEEIAYAPRQLGITGAALDELVHRYAKLLGVEHLLERPIHALSVGEKKRVALASILSYEPSLLLLDEPFAGLDPPGVAAILGHLCRLKASSATMLVSTQHLWLAEALADTVYIIEGGRVVWRGPPREEWRRVAAGHGFYTPGEILVRAGCGRICEGCG